MGIEGFDEGVGLVAEVKGLNRLRGEAVETVSHAAGLLTNAHIAGDSAPLTGLEGDENDFAPAAGVPS